VFSSLFPTLPLFPRSALSSFRSRLHSAADPFSITQHPKLSLNFSRGPPVRTRAIWLVFRILFISLARLSSCALRKSPFLTAVTPRIGHRVRNNPDPSPLFAFGFLLDPPLFSSDDELQQRVVSSPPSQKPCFPSPSPPKRASLLFGTRCLRPRTF